jgi:sugar phosphate isomerase/epimerase
MRPILLPGVAPRDILFAYHQSENGKRRDHVRVGVFTALLAQLSLDDVLKKLKSLSVSTVELGTGNYPGDPHCKLSMLENKMELNEFKQKLTDNGCILTGTSPRKIRRPTRRPSGWRKSLAFRW